MNAVPGLTASGKLKKSQKSQFEWAAAAAAGSNHQGQPKVADFQTSATRPPPVLCTTMHMRPLVCAIVACAAARLLLLAAAAGEGEGEGECAAGDGRDCDVLAAGE